MSILLESGPAFTSPKTVPCLTDDSAPLLYPDSIDDLIRQVAKLVKRETNLGVQEMQVSFESGTLVLSGYCRTFYTKQLAQQAVVSITGNVKLVNNIRVV